VGEYCCLMLKGLGVLLVGLILIVMMVSIRSWHEDVRIPVMIHQIVRLTTIIL